MKGLVKLFAGLLGVVVCYIFAVFLALSVPVATIVFVAKLVWGMM